jgi:hypothetical protein
MARPTRHGGRARERRQSAATVAASAEIWLGFAGRHRRAWALYVDFSDHILRASHLAGRPDTHEVSADGSPVGEYACFDPGSTTRPRPRTGSPS